MPKFELYIIWHSHVHFYMLWCVKLHAHSSPNLWCLKLHARKGMTLCALTRQDVQLLVLHIQCTATWQWMLFCWYHTLLTSNALCHFKDRWQLNHEFDKFKSVPCESWSIPDTYIRPTLVAENSLYITSQILTFCAWRQQPHRIRSWVISVSSKRTQTWHVCVIHGGVHHVRVHLHDRINFVCKSPAMQQRLSVVCIVSPEI